MANSFQIKMVLSIVGYPAIAASLGVVAARLAKPGSRARQAALAAAAAGGLITSHVALAGAPQLPPIDSIGWVPIVTLCAGLLGIVVSMSPRGERAPVAPVLAMALAAAAAVGLAGKPTFARNMAGAVPIGAGAIATAVIVTASAPRIAHRGFAAAGWLALLVTAALSGLCALWSSSASLATLLGSMATTAGVIGIGGLVLRIADPAPAAQGVFIAHMIGTLTYAHLYAKVPTVVMLLLAAAVTAPVLSVLVPGEGNGPRWGRAVLVLALAVAFAGGAAMIMHTRAARTGEAAV